MLGLLTWPRRRARRWLKRHLSTCLVVASCSAGAQDQVGLRSTEPLELDPVIEASDVDTTWSARISVLAAIGPDYEGADAYRLRAVPAMRVSWKQRLVFRGRSLEANVFRAHGLRNSHLLSIAPTGTISLAFADNASNGIEPAYSWQLLLEESRMDDGSKEQLRETARFPYGEFQEGGGPLIIKHMELNNRNLFYSLRSWSALINQLEYAYSHFTADNENADAVTEAAILEIRKLCKENNINFIVAILKEAEEGPSMKRFCEQNDIPAVDISIDYTNPGYLNQPFDGHPNGKAHALYAEKMYRYLTEEKWVYRTTK